MKTKPLAEITQRAIEVLSRELGVADSVRFINQLTLGHGDYTSERAAKFAGDTLEQIISDIKRTRVAKDPTQPELEP